MYCEIRWYAHRGSVPSWVAAIRASIALVDGYGIRWIGVSLSEVVTSTSIGASTGYPARRMAGSIPSRR